MARIKYSKQRHGSSCIPSPKASGPPPTPEMHLTGNEKNWLNIDFAGDQSLILLSAISSKFSWATELFMDSHCNVISHKKELKKILKICRWMRRKGEWHNSVGSFGGSNLNSPHTLRAHICYMGLCRSSVFRRAPAVSYKQHLQSLWIDSTGGIFSWLYKMED